MKKLTTLLLALVLVLTGCNNKDSIWNVMDDIDSRVSRLEALCQEMNTNIEALETLIKAQGDGDYITNITEIRNGSTVIGYTITFKTHEPITVYNGTNGKDGKDGINGYTPVIGAKQDTDGIYYWTVDGNWLTDANGNKLRVSGEKGDKGDKGDQGINGNTPQLKIDAGDWYLSYDGTNWSKLGKATGENGSTGEKGDKGDAGDAMFRSVTQDANYVYFTLADGTLIKIAKNGSTSGGDQPNSEFLFVVTYDANGGVGTMPQDTFYYGVAKAMSYNTYSKVNYRFDRWNTKQDGTGISYINGTTLTINKSITLYAQWTSKAIPLPGTFSISDTKKVQFSCGNLQYQRSTASWRFADNQFDCIGSDNSNANNEDYIGWVDQFVWGSGADPTNYNSTYISPFIDWGVNTIGLSSPNVWRTLTWSEWVYLLKNRNNADQLWAIGIINGVKGCIFLPDNFEKPLSISLIPARNGANSYTPNTYTIEQWFVLESAGAIFLPFGGKLNRNNGNLYCDDINVSGYYWYSEKVGYLRVYERNLPATLQFDNRFVCQVRLVQDCQ